MIRKKDDARMTAEDYLAIPYVLEVWSEPGPSGEWVRRARFPELPGCEVTADSALTAIERAEQFRIEIILGRLARGESIPVPRPPLRA